MIPQRFDPTTPYEDATSTSFAIQAIKSQPSLQQKKLSNSLLVRGYFLHWLELLQSGKPIESLLYSPLLDPQDRLALLAEIERTQTRNIGFNFAALGAQYLLYAGLLRRQRLFYVFARKGLGALGRTARVLTKFVLVPLVLLNLNGAAITYLSKNNLEQRLARQGLFRKNDLEFLLASETY